MLYERQAMMAMPICANMVIDKLLVNTKGAKTKHQRKSAPDDPTPNVVGFEFVNSSHGLTFACAQEAFGPEDQNQNQEQVGQDRCDL
jgi:hypothetical protein